MSNHISGRHIEIYKDSKTVAYTLEESEYEFYSMEHKIQFHFEVARAPAFSTPPSHR